jgi:hypothetical protein
VLESLQMSLGRRDFLSRRVFLRLAVAKSGHGFF